MNLANKITLFRVFLIPIFLIVLLSGLVPHPWNRYAACIIFVLASATDALDGYIARSRNLITNLGKFMDPLADKLLVCSAFIALIELKDLAAWVVIIIISREFIITGFRVIAADNNIVIAASFWGKIKTITQMLMATYLLLGLKGGIWDIISYVLIGLAVFFTILSGMDYVVKNKQVLTS